MWSHDSMFGASDPASLVVSHGESAVPSSTIAEIGNSVSAPRFPLPRALPRPRDEVFTPPPPLARPPRPPRLPTGRPRPRLVGRAASASSDANGMDPAFAASEEAVLLVRFAAVADSRAVSSSASSDPLHTTDAHYNAPCVDKGAQGVGSLPFTH